MKHRWQYIPVPFFILPFLNPSFLVEANGRGLTPGSVVLLKRRKMENATWKINPRGALWLRVRLERLAVSRNILSVASCRSRSENPPKAKHIQTKKCPFLEASCFRGENRLVSIPSSGLTALVLINYNALCCGHKMPISPCADSMQRCLNSDTQHLVS